MHARLVFEFQTATTIPNTHPRSRGAMRPSCAGNIRPQMRAQGMPGARSARSLACSKKTCELVTTVTPETPGIPRAMVLTVSFVLSPVIGLCCHRRLWIESANLTPASRRQDHTTSPSAGSALVRSTTRVHRIPSRVRDDRETPLCGTGWRQYRFDLGRRRSGKFFHIGLDRANQIDLLQQIRFLAQRAGAWISLCPPTELRCLSPANGRLRVAKPFR
jgi:hypothetical protein